MSATIFRLVAAILLCLVAGTVLHADDGTDQPDSVSSAELDWEQAVQSALDQKATLKHVELELREFAARLSELTGQLCLLDDRALNDIGISDDVPLTFAYRDMTVRNILQHVLRDLDLTWTPRDGAILITTPEQVEIDLHTRVIDVADLVRPFPGASEDQFDYHSLIRMITAIVAPTSWGNVGGPGTIDGYGGGLVVSQTREVHEEIDTLLTQLREAHRLARQHPDSPPSIPQVGPSQTDPATARIEAALKQQIVPDFGQVPLREVADQLGALCGINLVVDRRALEDIAIGMDVPVSLQANQIQLRHALRHMLRPLDLTTMIRGGALIITTPEEAENCQASAVYPIADLVSAADVCDAFGNSRRWSDMDQLVDLVTSTVVPDSWSDVGGPGDIATVPHIDVLIVTQTQTVHGKIVNLLSMLRRQIAMDRPAAADPQAAESIPARTRLVIYGVPSAQSIQRETETNGTKRGGAQSLRAIEENSVLGQMGIDAHCMGGIPSPNTLDTIIPENDLLVAIVELVEPDSWKSRDDVYVKVLPGRLLVRHTDRVHRKIEMLLRKLGVPYATNLESTGFSAEFNGGMF